MIRSPTGSCSRRGTGRWRTTAALVADGLFDEAPLSGFVGYGPPLGHHSDRLLVPGAEIGRGSLRHGLPPALGSVLGLRARGLTHPRAWILVGDAELDEGSNREAIAHAGPAGLDELHTLVIGNASAPTFPGSKRPAGRSGPWTGASTRRCTRPAPHPTPASSRSDRPRRPRELTPAPRHTSASPHRNEEHLLSWTPCVNASSPPRRGSWTTAPRPTVAPSEIGRGGFDRAQSAPIRTG